LEVKDEMGSRFFKALISWGFVPDVPGMEVRPPTTVIPGLVPSGPSEGLLRAVTKIR
jgi:hypothetical protein